MLFSVFSKDFNVGSSILASEILEVPIFESLNTLYLLASIFF
jgi:hypothetical protein